MWQDPNLDETGILFIIFAIIAVWLFISGAYKKGKGYGALSIVATGGLLFAFIQFPNLQPLVIGAFLLYLAAGLLLSFVYNLFHQ